MAILAITTLCKEHENQRRRAAGRKQPIEVQRLDGVIGELNLRWDRGERTILDYQYAEILERQRANHKLRVEIASLQAASILRSQILSLTSQLIGSAAPDTDVRRVVLERLCDKRTELAAMEEMNKFRDLCAGTKPRLEQT